MGAKSNEMCEPLHTLNASFLECGEHIVGTEWRALARSAGGDSGQSRGESWQGPLHHLLKARGSAVITNLILIYAMVSAYLTVSETFPLEVRALAIAFFYALGTGIGGVAGPWVFGALIDTGSRWSLYGGYLIGSVLMLAAAVIAARYGVAAERKPLESVSRPLAAAD